MSAFETIKAAYTAFGQNDPSARQRRYARHHSPAARAIAAALSGLNIEYRASAVVSRQRRNESGL